MRTQLTKSRLPAPPETSEYTTLHGRRLTITRAVCVAVALLTVTLFVAGLPLLYDWFRTVYIHDLGSRDVLSAHLTQLHMSIDFYIAYLLLLGIIPAVAYFAVATIIFWRKSDEPMALFTALLLVLFGATIWGSTEELGVIHPILEWLNRILESLSFAFLFLFFYLFPDGRFVPRWTRWLAGVLIAVTVLTALFPASPLNIERGSTLTYVLVLLGWLLAGVCAQVYRYLRVSSPIQRQQTKWVFFGYTAALGGYLGWISLYAILPLVRPGSRLVADMIGATVTSCLMLIIPMSFGVAILRYRLYDIDVLINRTLVYGSLTAMLAVVYFGGVATTQAIFRFLTGQEEQPQLAIVVSTLLIAAMFNPVRRRIQSFIDRSFYRRKYDARKTLEAFAAELREETDLDALSEDLLEAVRETMQPTHVTLWLRTDHALKDKKKRAAIRESGHAD
jgi:hypothetical protein